MQLRGSSGWWVCDWWKSVSSRTETAAARPLSPSPTLPSVARGPDGGGRGRLVHRRHGDDGIAVVERLVGQVSLVTRALRRRKIVRGEDGFHAVHRQSRT